MVRNVRASVLVGRFVADGTLLFRLASERFRAQLRWAAGLLLVWACLPADGWSSERVALSATAATLLVATLAPLSAPALARLTLGIVGAFYVLVGSSVAAAVHAGERALEGHVSIGVVAFALAAAAVELASERSRARSVRRLLAAASACATLYYVWPWPSVGPAARLASIVHPLRAHAASWNVLSAAMIVALTLSPSVLVAFAWYHARRQRRIASPHGLVLGLYGIPALLLPIVSRSLAGSRDFAALVVLAGEVVAAAAMLVAIGCSSVVVARWSGVETTSSWSKRRAVLAAVGAIVLTLTPWALGRERPAPWRLGPASSRGDELFAKQLPAWNDARPPGDGTTVLLGAIELTPELVPPLEALIAASERQETSSSAWSARVSELNDASRRARLPYYVAPTEIVVHGASRWYRLETYRIDSVAHFEADKRVIELLSVRALRPERSRSPRLGLSRDDEPRVLVVLDAIDAYAHELEGLAQRQPARCTVTSAKRPAREAALLGCGKLLRDAANKGQIRTALVRAVTRHELQHQLDARSPPTASILSGRARAKGVPIPPHINRELSAYLAELTTADGVPELSLARLLRLAVIDELGVDGTAARLVLDALVGRDEAAPERHSAETAFAELALLDAAALRERARRVWAKQFGSELRTVVELHE